MKTRLISKTYSVLAVIVLALSLISARATELIVNGGFEQGSTGWTWSSANGLNPVSDLYNDAHSGSYYLWLGDDNGTDSAYQTITIPSTASEATLTFYWNINSSETSGTPDTFTATIRDTSGNILATVVSLSNQNGTPPGNPYYTEQSYDLSSYAGRTIRIYFVSNCTLTGSKTTNFRVDDVSVAVTTSTTKVIALTGNLTFGSVAVNSSAQNTLTIANNGNSTLTVSSISYPSGFSGNWSGTIAASSSQPVTVTFSPTSATSYGGTVTVNSDATSGVNTITASGTGTATPTKIISLSGNLAFGSVTVGASPQSTLTINNTGNATMTVTGISYPSGFSGNWSSGAIVAGGSQNVTVTFSPTSAITYGGTVTVNSDATSGVNTIAASGTGTVTSTQPLGVDVSSWTGTVNWSQVSNPGGKAFAIIRASAGVNTTDSQFAQNAPNAHAAGLLVGTYHFAYPQYFTAQNEAQKFLSVASAYIGSGFLPPALDIEDSPSEDSYPYQMGQTALCQWIRDWCTAVKQATGVTPMVYTTRYYANNYFDANINQYPFWVPTYSATDTPPNSNPGNISPWSTWTFQQYEADPTTQGGGTGGTCPGISGYALLDSFNGTLSALQALANQTPTVTKIISLNGNLAFANVTVGSSAQSTLTINNTGNTTMTVSSISYPSGFSGAWSGTIAAGGSQPVSVTFSPTSATTYGGTVTVNSDATSGANTIAASGTGTLTPTKIISLTGNLAFGNVTVGSLPQSTMTINNTGNATLTVSSISYPSGFSGAWSGTIAAGGSQPVSVTFSPTSATTYGGTVTVNSDATSGGNTIAASGTGTVEVENIISLTGNLAFGSVTVGSSPQRTFTINNTGAAPLTVSSISYPSAFSGNWSGTIAAGNSQTVIVTFSPTSAISYGGTVTVNSDATSGANTIVASGTGTLSPQLTGMNVSNGQFCFNLNGPVGSNYVIYESSDLVHWKPLSTYTIPSCGSFSCADPAVATYPQRFYRAVLTNTAPPIAAPTVSTLPATSITASSATLNSSVVPNGVTTTIYFQYGPTTSYGSTTISGNIGTSAGDYGTVITGLSANTPYHFRIVAYNSTGTSYGSDLTFTTSQ